MTSASTAVVILDFISRASRRTKCHISSSVSREAGLSPATNPRPGTCRRAQSPGQAKDAGGAQSRTCMADMVRAVVQTGPRQMEMREYPRPVIGPDDGAL